jgi:predicted nucleotidyltransferase
MEEIRFIHKVSKGSRFNQIYIPSEKEKEFEPGDLVEIKLLKKNIKIHYSKNLEKLTRFKEKLIEEIFSFLARYKEIKQIFIFGSFLTQKIDYNDIDILILTQKKEGGLDSKIYDHLINIFNLKFHVIFFNEKKLKGLLEICPLTRSMLYSYVSNKEFKIPKETKINYNHIKFLLMMPEDLLKVNLDYGIEYYNALRKLFVIENFLVGKEIPPNEVGSYLEKLMDKGKLELLKRNEIMDENILKEVKGIIRNKLEVIYKKINYKEGNYGKKR